MRRRKYLSVTGLVAVLPGCISDSSTVEFKLHRILIMNRLAEDIGVTVTIEEDEAVVYEKEHQIEAVDGSSTSSVEIKEETMTKVGDYNVTIHVGDSDSGGSATFSSDGIEGIDGNKIELITTVEDVDDVRLYTQLAED